MSTQRTRRTLALLSLVALAGCASTPDAGPAAPADSTDDSAYQAAARAAYERGVRALDGHDYPIAVQRFDEVRTRYPYSSFAPLAELGLADTLFAEGRYLEAADAYRTFQRLRPAHEKVDYAAFREGLSLHRQAPNDMFILPPAYEKDLTQVNRVRQVLTRFIETYPDSPHVGEARALVAEARTRLARHELYVADFYARREEWRGAAGRLETAIVRYDDLPIRDEARVRLAEVYLAMPQARPKGARSLVEAVLESELATPAVKADAAAVRQTLAALPAEAFSGDEPSTPVSGSVTRQRDDLPRDGRYAKPKEQAGPGAGPR